MPTLDELAALKRDMIGHVDAFRGALDRYADALGDVLHRFEGAPAPQPAPPPTPQPAPVDRRVTRGGTRLLRGGKPFRFVGINLEHAVGCGQPGAQPSDDQADAFFLGLGDQPKVVRIWVMPGMLPTANGKVDFSRYDRIVSAATKHGHYLIVTLLNGQPHCTNRQVTDYSTPGNLLPQWQSDWIGDVVLRHADNPTFMAAELANEGNEGHPNIGSWYGAGAALVRGLAPDVLVFTGGGHNSSNSDVIAEFVRRSGVDGFSLHDYVKPPGISPRGPIFERASALTGVPWYMGEFGYSGPAGGGDSGSQEENAKRLIRDLTAYMAFRNLFGAVYWDARFNQRETSTAYPPERTGLWRAICDYRVPVSP